VVIGGVVFQNEMQKRYPSLVAALGLKPRTYYREISRRVSGDREGAPGTAERSCEGSVRGESEDDVDYVCGVLRAGIVG
jgi:hypothetical protein